ncbi:MAG: 50S ribosomal protein L9 [Clostridiales Family XIII bacterium]|jgi:large subunit ribosomal protein L9|nr:50S ribosomal protein L9 [Clostridiales Family XIII bacterium]
MKVILLEDIVGAGKAGEVVEVKNGYARNKLLPSGQALAATKANLVTLEHRRAKIAAKKTADIEAAQLLKDHLDGRALEFTAKAGDAGKLFGSITAQDIATALSEQTDFEIDRRKFLLDAPIKQAGDHNIAYRIYPEVEAIIKVTVKAEGGTVRIVEPPRDTYSDAALAADEDDYTGGAAGRAKAAAKAEAAAAAKAAAAEGAAADAEDAVDAEDAADAADTMDAADTETVEIAESVEIDDSGDAEEA